MSFLQAAVGGQRCRPELRFVCARNKMSFLLTFRFFRHFDQKFSLTCKLSDSKFCTNLLSDGSPVRSFKVLPL